MRKFIYIDRKSSKVAPIYFFSSCLAFGPNVLDSFFPRNFIKALKLIIVCKDYYYKLVNMY
jgi:hypothetical protein